MRLIIYRKAAASKDSKIGTNVKLSEDLETVTSMLMKIKKI